MRQSSSPQAGTALAPTREVEGVIPQWVSELRGAIEPEDGEGGQGTESNEDWLARLREAAMIEPERATEEPIAITEEVEPLPIPQWFAQIRPSIPVKPMVPPPGVAVLEPAPPDTKQHEPSKAVEKPSAPSADAEELPEWLVQLQSLPLPMEHEPPAESATEQSTTSAQPEEAISKVRGELVESPAAWAGEAPQEEPAATVQVTNEPPGSGPFTLPPTEAFEQEEVSEIPLTREEELGLPDWLASPIEPATLLAEIGEKQESKSPAEWEQFLASEADAFSEVLPERADAADVHRPSSRLGRITAGIRTWLRAWWQRLFPTRKLEFPPAETTFVEQPDVEARISTPPAQREPAGQATHETAPAYGNDLPEWLTKMPEFEATLVPAVPQPAASRERSEYEDLPNWLPEPSPKVRTETVVAEAKPQDPEGIATWPLPEDFTADVPVLADEIRHALVPGDPPVAQTSPESSAVQPTTEQGVTGPPMVEQMIFGVTIPAQPATGPSATK